jgi:hypothetical protein
MNLLVNPSNHLSILIAPQVSLSNKSPPPILSLGCFFNLVIIFSPGRFHMASMPKCFDLLVEGKVSFLPLIINIESNFSLCYLIRCLYYWSRYLRTLSSNSDHQMELLLFYLTLKSIFLDYLVKVQADWEKQRFDRVCKSKFKEENSTAVLFWSLILNFRFYYILVKQTLAQISLRFSSPTNSRNYTLCGTALNRFFRYLILQDGNPINISYIQVHSQN